jgi:hypothetical protein
MNRTEALRRLAEALGKAEGDDAARELLAALEGDTLPDWLEMILAAAEDLPMRPVPPLASQNARRIMDPPGLIEHGVAQLIRDGRVDAPMAGVRGGQTMAGWTLLYTSEPLDIALDVWPGPDSIAEVEGQVLGHPAGEVAYKVILVGDSRHEVATDWLGRFRLGQIPMGEYAATVSDGRVHVEFTVKLSEESA